MNNWWKAGLLGAGALGLTALTGGLGAGLLPEVLGGEGAVAGAAGAAGAEAAGAGAAAAGTGAGLAEGTAAATAGTEAATTAAAASPTAFVTAPVATPWAAAGETSGMLAGTDAGYGTAASNSLLASGGAGSGGSGVLSGTLAGTDAGYGGTAMANAPSAAPSMLQQAGQYASTAGKAASAYGTVNSAMGGGQPHAAPPAPHPIFQGPAPQIAPGMMAPQQNQFAQMLLAQRQRGMLG